MQRQIQLSGKTYTLTSNAYTPIAYKLAFGKDYFQDLFQMLQAKSLLNKLDVVGPVLMEMLNQGMTTQKKSMKQRQRARKSSQ